MTVYIEYVIADNFAVTLITAYLTLRALRLKILPFRLFITGAIGSAAAVLLPLLPQLFPPLFLIIRLATGFLLVFLAADFRTAKQYLRAVCVFFGVTFGLGGAVFGLLFMLDGDFVRAVTMGYEQVPISVIIFGVFSAMFIVKVISGILQRRRDRAPFYCRVKLFLGSVAVELHAYLDSGNMIYDTAGNPVILVSKDAVGQLLAGNLLYRRIAAAGHIDVSTINGKTRVSTFVFNKIEIYSGQAVNILYDVTVGLTDKRFEDFECLLHPALI